MLIIDILDDASFFQVGGSQPSRQRPVFLPKPLLVHQHGKAFSGSAREFEKPPIGGDLSVLPFLGLVASGFRP